MRNSFVKARRAQRYPALTATRTPALTPPSQTSSSPRCLHSSSAALSLHTANREALNSLSVSRLPAHGPRRALATIASPSPSSPASANIPLNSERKPMFNKILIANRGEIAVRVMRTCRQLGILTVAVFSEADRHAQHVLQADEAYCIGPALSSESYLSVDKIVDVVKRSGAQAVHPGYGFLSENAAFAERLEKEGIVFIGPPPSAITSMGSKSESKDIMIKAGVPCIPGWHPSSNSDPSSQSPEALIVEADKIGYPVLIKAVSGGGGKGMKIVDRREDFIQQLESAKREGQKSFNDDTVLLEKYLPTSRHVEVQIFSDSHDNHVSIFERDCSVQRRHQKVIEEAPAPGLSTELRERLYDCARKAAKAVGYRGAGTVEFIMDAENNDNFYFLEMNVRLQVEHCVSEAISGLDLVQWQLEVAAGNPLPLDQSQIICTGHAFECRIYAENPNNNFLPDTGLLTHVRPPPEGNGVRLETGFISGDEISVFYDPLIAKLIVHGSDRTDALRVLRKALAEYQVVGPHTNIEFLKRLASNKAFIDGEVETAFIPNHYNELFAPPEEPSASTLASAGVALAISQLRAATSSPTSPKGPWGSPLFASYRVGTTPASTTTTFSEVVETSASSPSATDATPASQSRTANVTVTPSGTAFSVSVIDFDGTITDFGTSSFPIVGDKVSTVDVVADPRSSRLHLFDAPRDFVGQVDRVRPDWVDQVTGAKEGAKGSAKAPMPSRIVQIFVKAGDSVEQGAPLLVVEAMKTEHVLRAPNTGVVKNVTADIGQLVPEGKVLVTFEEEGGAASE